MAQEEKRVQVPITNINHNNDDSGLLTIHVPFRETRRGHKVNIE